MGWDGAARRGGPHLYTHQFHWDLPPGTYDWWVQPQRANGAELGPWSDVATFTISD